MARWVALLRGINVGGRNRVAMADLRRVCRDLGHRDVRTYVQSGNVVLDADVDDPDALAAAMSAALDRELGVAPDVVVRRAEELAAVVAGNPFPEAAAADPATVHVAFLSAEPVDPVALEVDAAAFVPEEFVAGERVRYLYLPDGMGRSPLAEELARRRLDVTMTVRNWRTLRRVLEMTQETPRG